MTAHRLALPAAALTAAALVVTLIGVPSGAQAAPSARVAAVASVADTGADPEPGADVAPAPAVTLTGTPVVGQALYAQPGEWPEGTTLSYRWFVDGVEDTGPAVGERYYYPQWEDEGLRVHVVVTGLLPGGDVETRASEPSLRVAKAPTVEVEGRLRVGALLTAQTRWTEAFALAYEWRIDGVRVPGATDRTFVVPDEAEGARVSVRVTGVADEYPTVSRTSSTLSSVIMRVGTPTIGGDAVVGATLTGDTGVWGDRVTVYRSWVVAGKTVGSSTSLVVTEAMLGKTITFSVRGIATGATAQVASVTTPVVIAPGTPTVTGSAVVGSTLTAVPGSWAEGTTFAYQWAADGVDISGATAATYRVPSAMKDRALTVRVTGAISGRTTLIATSAATPRVLVSGAPSITGKNLVGSTLRAVPGTWTPGTVLTYQWFVGKSMMHDGTTSTFRLDHWMTDLPIRVEVTGTRPGYGEATRAAATAAVVYVPPVEVSGSFAAYDSIVVDSSGWRKGTKLTYQWLRDGRPISKQTDWWYELKRADVGHHITARVTAAVPGHGVIVQVSASKGRIGLATTPSVKGTQAVGFTLRAHVYRWMDGTRFSYQWYADEFTIPGARGATLEVTKALAGKRIHVEVTGRTPGFAVVTNPSAPTARIMLARAPSISGAAVVGRTLTATPGAWTAGTRFTYQWYADGKAIRGATKATFAVTSAQRGRVLTVKATGKKSGYATVLRTSKPTSRVR